MKNYWILGLALAVFFGCQQKQASQSDETTEEQASDEVIPLNWRLASQAYTFKEFTFAETLDKLDSLGVKYVEAYRGQQIGGGYEGTTHFSMDAATRQVLKKMLADKGIIMVNYGVVRASDEAEWRSIFEFAKDMGIETLTAEPEPEHFEFLAPMTEEYGINLAIHNHPEPSRYWHPDSVLMIIEKYDNDRIGACADVGHWIRSGLNPIESLQALEGNIISLHFKDLNEMTREAHDVPWGQGVGNAKGMLEELKRQRFEGVFSIEYEHNWLNSMPEVKQCVDFFNETQAQLM